MVSVQNDWVGHVLMGREKEAPCVKYHNPETGEARANHPAKGELSEPEPE